MGFPKVHEGCREEALKLSSATTTNNTVICDFRAPMHPTVTEQLDLLREVIIQIRQVSNEDAAADDDADTGSNTTTKMKISGIAIAPLTNNKEMVDRSDWTSYSNGDYTNCLHLIVSCQIK